MQLQCPGCRRAPCVAWNIPAATATGRIRREALTHAAAIHRSDTLADDAVGALVDEAPRRVIGYLRAQPPPTGDGRSLRARRRLSDRSELMQVQADPMRGAEASPSSGAGAWRAALGAAALLLASCAGQGPPLPPPPAHLHGQALWQIIHDQCVPDQRANGVPAPCELVSMPDGEARGYVILKDRNGVAQYLVMPTAKITGIEDPALLAPGATNYFARAWGARRFVEARLGHTLDRSQISVAVNSPYGRSQDQLHLHVDCLDASVGAALRSADIPQNGRWTRVDLKGHAYRVRWLKDEQTLEAVNPFKLLAKTVPGARRAMGAWTLALVGARTPDGVTGFYLLADRANPAAGDRGSSEELQDHACRM